MGKNPGKNFAGFLGDLKTPKGRFRNQLTFRYYLCNGYAPALHNGTLIKADFQILGYLGDILEDLGHPLTDNLGCLSRLLRLPIKDVMSSSDSEERDFQKIFAQVQKMRNIKL